MIEPIDIKLGMHVTLKDETSNNNRPATIIAIQFKGDNSIKNTLVELEGDTGHSGDDREMLWLSGKVFNRFDHNRWWVYPSDMDERLP